MGTNDPANKGQRKTSIKERGKQPPKPPPPPRGRERPSRPANGNSDNKKQ